VRENGKFPFLQSLRVFFLISVLLDHELTLQVQPALSPRMFCTLLGFLPERVLVFHSVQVFVCPQLPLNYPLSEGTPIRRSLPHGFLSCSQRPVIFNISPRSNGVFSSQLRNFWLGLFPVFKELRRVSLSKMKTKSKNFIFDFRIFSQSQFCEVFKTYALLGIVFFSFRRLFFVFCSPPPPPLFTPL